MLCHSAFVRVATDATMSYDTAPGLCHSAFVRVATQLSTIYTRHSVFATAHSCGLRRQIISEALTYFALPQRIRAGCDDRKEVDHSGNRLCHSAFVRVATMMNYISMRDLCFFATAHSCGLRRGKRTHICGKFTLPQRIRAGCDDFRLFVIVAVTSFATAHSCGLRRWSMRRCMSMCAFATAHSCGLRLRKSNAAHCEFAARR